MEKLSSKLMTDLTDQEIISGCTSGDRQIQEAFVYRFTNLVFESILGTLKVKNVYLSRQDLEDLHNTIFVKLFEKNCKRLTQYKGKNGCSLSSWIRIISVRTVLDHLSKTSDALARPERVKNLDMEPELKEESPNPLSLVQTAEQYQLIKKGLKSLSVREQLFLKLHCFEGLPIKQVAGILGLSISNAHSLKHRTIKRLRNKIVKEKDIQP